MQLPNLFFRSHFPHVPWIRVLCANSFFFFFPLLVLRSLMTFDFFCFCATLAPVLRLSLKIACFHYLLPLNPAMFSRYVCSCRVLKSRRMRWAEHVERMEDRRCLYRVLVGKREGKRPLGRSRRRWKDNIRTDLQAVECGGMDRIELAQYTDRWWALVNAVMNVRFP